MLLPNPTTYKTHNRILTYQELIAFTTFMVNLSNESNRRRKKLVFRGVNYTHLKSTLNIEENDYNKLNEFIFLIGEKGRVYRKQYRRNLKPKDTLFDIDDSSPAFFDYIFEYYTNLLSNKKKEILEFKENNRAMARYFLKKENKSSFLEILDAMEGDERLQIRDYYLAPLHHIGRIGFHNNSFLLSTTISSNVSRKFAGDNHDRIILVAWEPYLSKGKINRQHLSFSDFDVKKLNLPTYSSSFFPNQKEISAKGGLFPHYIIGYIKDSLNEFEINPNLFTTIKPFTRIIEEGFDIDQSTFTKRIKETDYELYFSRDEAGHYVNFSS